MSTKTRSQLTPFLNKHPMLLLAAYLVVFENNASINKLSKSLKIALVEAKKILDYLEEAGVISSPNSRGRHEVLWTLSELALEAVTHANSLSEQLFHALQGRNVLNGRVPTAGCKVESMTRGGTEILTLKELHVAWKVEEQINADYVTERSFLKIVD